MWKNRLYYFLLAGIFAGFLFFFGIPYLAVVLAGMAALALLLWILLLGDAERLTVEAGIQAGSREGKSIPLVLNVRKKGVIRAAGGVLVEVELYHTMYDVTERKKLLLPLTGRSFCYDMPVDADYCGELCVRCNSIESCDLLNLFRVRMEAFREVRTMIYPRRINLNAELSRDAIGSPKNDGLLQNRKGNDPSEIFDLRDYAPGDDVRSIHWKLSGKLDKLVVKEASDPSHYQVVLMPDLGLEELGNEKTLQQLNTAIALFASVGEQLIRQCAAFYVTIPARYGLRFSEVRSSREFQDALSQWMSIGLPERSGLGIRYFIMEHMEQYFSKILIISSGKYLKELNSLEGRINITVISAVAGTEFAHIKLNQTCDVVEIPVVQEAKEAYRVIC